MYDAIIVGGSFAGISAGLQLARARRNVLVIDGGKRRNRFAATSHGFLGHDGRAPGDIVSDGRQEFLAYPTAEWIDGEAASAENTGDGFAITLGDGIKASGKRLLLAIGVRDTLPKVPGLSELWGKSVFHCPYCHGYELDRQPVGVLGVNEGSMHHALMLPDWSPTTFFVNQAFDLTGEHREQLKARNVAVEETPIRAVSGPGANVHLVDGRSFAMAGLFTATWNAPASALPEQLGCALDDNGFATTIRTDGMKQTTIPGVFAAGDAARPFGNVAIAVADGALAGASAHRSLMFPEM